jgi:hypothetical protein
MWLLIEKMKNRYKLIQIPMLVWAITACTNVETVNFYKNPNIELVSAYSISENTAEVNVDFTEVFQPIKEAGIVWSEKPSATKSDQSDIIVGLEEDSQMRFTIANLQKGKTYYVRAYYIDNNSKEFYSNEIAFTQNFSGMWTRLESPELEVDDYVYPYDLGNLNGIENTITCYKVNRATNNSVLQVYFRDFAQWNPNYWNNRIPKNQPPRNMIFNPIRAGFQSNGNFSYTIYGGGHQELPRNKGNLYQKAIYLLESNGSWEPYPGANAATTSFGIGAYPYVLENLPNGKVWQFDYSVLKWYEWGRVPTTKPARLLGFDIGERAFVMVEPEDPQQAMQELYEYIPNQKNWLRKTDFPAENRRSVVWFSIGARLFVGCGQAIKDGRPLRDIWEYSVANNSWRKVADYPGSGGVNMLGIGFNTTANIGFGQNAKLSSTGANDYRQANDFWLFRP